MLWFKSCEDNVHKFEPRYDEKHNGNNVKFNNASGCSIYELADAIKNASTNLIYVHDICVRCGKIIKRDNNGK
jgi:hypothetical protein